MLSTLHTLGFGGGGSFVNWVRLFYMNVQSAVNVNGYVFFFLFVSW